MMTQLHFHRVLFAVLLAAGVVAGCSSDAGDIPFASAARAKLGLNVKFPREIVPQVDGKHAAVLATPVTVATFEIAIGQEGSEFFVKAGPFVVENTADVQEVVVDNIPAGTRPVLIVGRAGDGTVIISQQLIIDFVPGQIASNDVEFNESGSVDVTPAPTPPPTPTPPPATSRFVITENFTSKVSIVDPNTGSRQQLVDLNLALGVADAAPTGVVVDAVTGNFVVCCEVPGMVVKLNQLTGTVNATGTGVSAPAGIAQNSNDDFLVGSLGAIVRFDNGLLSGAPFTSPIGRGFGVAADGGADYFFADELNQRIDKAPALGAPNSSTLVKNTALNDPFSVAILPAGQLLITETAATNRIYTIDRVTGAEIASVSLGSVPRFACLDPLTGRAVVALSGDGTLVEVDFATGTQRVIFNNFPGGAGPFGVAVAP